MSWLDKTVPHGLLLERTSCCEPVASIFRLLHSWRSEAMSLGR